MGQISPELAIRILHDWVPGGALDAVHLMGQTADNQESVLGRAVELLLARRCAQLTIMDEAISGYPGGRAWKTEIQQRLGDIRIPLIELPFPLDDRGVKMSHTYGEAVAVVSAANKRGWKRIGIVAQPLHALRSFAAFVTVVLSNLPRLKVYNIVGLPLPWNESVVHSQGTLRGLRRDLLREELARCHKYQLQGKLVSQDAILTYLNRRDGEHATGP